MRRSQTRFVTVCQQLLALGVICALLTPATTIMSLELVPEDPASQATQPGAAPALSMAAYERARERTSVVPTETVDPTVTEYALTAPAGARVLPGSLAASSRRTGGGSAQLLSTPQPVRGYGAVGVTWGHGLTVPDDAIGVQVRTSTDDVWSAWMDVEYHDDHGPDPASDEGRRARPGTEPMLVGDVDQVQVKVDAAVPPADMKLAVIDPGRATRTASQKAALDTGGPAAGAATVDPDDLGEPSTPPAADGEDALTLSAASYTPKPVIYSRAQWGADESMRDKGSLRYFEVHAGFVHHTVNANTYQADDVPAIIRGIYAYHTRSQGWSDIGYNYLVDRFGRIWEGRAGGIDRPVVGAHTLGYNDDSFAMSAIGNYEVTKPSSATVQAFGALMGWKLSLHGVDASSTRQYVTSRTFPAINGHRDAGSTACPGKFLYARIADIRTLATQAQVGFGGRQLESDLAGTDRPDLVVRRASDGQAFVIPLRRGAAGVVSTGRPIASSVVLTSADRLLNAGDWDRDGHADLITRRAGDGTLFLRRGLGNGTFAPVQRLAPGFQQVGLLAAVGDMTGDGWPDLMGQPAGGSMTIYPGRGVDGFRLSFVAYSRVDAARQVPIGLWGADGAPDSLFVKGTTLSVFNGNGPGGLTGGPRTLGLSLAPYDWVVGISDIDLVGHPDLVTRSKGTGELWLLEATASGIGAPQQIGSGMEIYDMVG